MYWLGLSIILLERGKMKYPNSEMLPHVNSPPRKFFDAGLDSDRNSWWSTYEIRFVTSISNCHAGKLPAGVGTIVV